MTDEHFAIRGDRVLVQVMFGNDHVARARVVAKNEQADLEIGDIVSVIPRGQQIILNGEDYLLLADVFVLGWHICPPTLH